MKINVNFSIEVKPEHLAALRELACADTNEQARAFMQIEAQGALVGYLTDNGVPVKITKHADGMPG